MGPNPPFWLRQANRKLYISPLRCFNLALSNARPALSHTTTFTNIYLVRLEISPDLHHHHHHGIPPCPPLPLTHHPSLNPPHHKHPPHPPQRKHRARNLSPKLQSSTPSRLSPPHQRRPTLLVPTSSRLKHPLRNPLASLYPSKTPCPKLPRPKRARSLVSRFRHLGCARFQYRFSRRL